MSIVSHALRRSVLRPAFWLLLSVLLQPVGCTYSVVSKRDDVRVLSSRVVDSRTVYGVKGVSLTDGTLAIALDRGCEEVLEVQTESVSIETRRYDTAFAWIGVAAVSFIAMSAAVATWISIDDDCEFFGDCTAGDNTRLEDERSRAGWVTGGVIVGTAVLAGVVLYYDLSEPESATVTGRDTSREQRVNACPGSWPVGDATLAASAVGTKFAGRSLGDGIVEIDVREAPPELWYVEVPLDLKLPGSSDWVAVELPQTVRKAGQGLAGADAVQANRAYLRYDGDEKYKGLLDAGATRVQSVLTDARRYQFVSDDGTRRRIEQLIDDAGGSVEDRRRIALEAARQENIAKVFQLTVKPLYESQVLLVLTVHNTVSGDQVFTRDAPADLGDAFKALETFDGLGRAYLAWEDR